MLLDLSYTNYADDVKRVDTSATVFVSVDTTVKTVRGTVDD